MKHIITNFLTKHIFPIILVFITGWIALANYTPDTWLTGWDTLHPEFNFSLNFDRIIDGVWREEQGLGAVAAHAHMSELPRYIFLYITSFVFPLSFLRYLYIFVCLIAGPLGMYFFLKNILGRASPAFLGALFYLCNIAVLHMFYVPFEMFPTQFAFMPWIILFTKRFIDKRKRSDLIWFTICSFVATPQAYAPQLWYAFFGLLMSFSCVYTWFISRKISYVVKSIGIIAGLTLVINAFWFLPHVYHVTHNATYIPEAKINELFSERMFAFNKARGTIKDVAILQGALYDWSYYDGTRFNEMFAGWNGHLDNQYILSIGYAGFALVVFGLLISMRKNNPIGIGLFPAFLGSMIVLMNMNPPFDGLFGLLQKSVPLFKEALRSPYTKFSIVLLFTYSFYAAYALDWIMSQRKKLTQGIITAVVALLLVLYMLPFFKGQLINPGLRREIPAEYFELFEWFETQPHDTRIATIPDHTHWGWEYYDWGYQGAGFIWFGLPQSVLVRDFDRWNPKNENFYWEFSHAIYAQDSQLFNDVIDKYQVDWLLVDKNVIFPDSPKTLYFDQVEEMIRLEPDITKVASFGDIVVYKNRHATSTSGSFVGPIYQWGDYDTAYQNVGNYVTDDQTDPDYYYPFRSLFTGKNSTDDITIRPRFDGYSFEKNITDTLNLSDYVLHTTGSSDVLPYVRDEAIEQITTENIIQIEQDTLSVFVPQITDAYSYDSRTDNLFYLREIQKCDADSDIGSVDSFRTQENSYRLKSDKTSGCLTIELPNMPHRYGYILAVESKHITGSPLLFSVVNLNSRKEQVTKYLSKSSSRTVTYFVIPPMERYGVGYSLLFTNQGIGSDESVNDLYSISIQPFDYDVVSQIVLEKRTKNEKSHVYVYDQSFDPGWQAYIADNRLEQLFPAVFADKLEEHVLVSNWANGWLLPEDTANSSIEIIFLPQYLEYAGFGLLLMGILAVIFYPKNKLRE